MIDSHMAASLSERLARHRARRRKGQAIVSAWRCPWPFEPDAVAEVLGGPVVSSHAERLETASHDWMLQWLGQSRLEALISSRLNTHLAEALGVTPERAMTVLSETPAQDRSALLEQAEARVPSKRLARLLRWWIMQPQRGGREGIVVLDRSLSDLDPRPDVRTLVSMAELCPAEDRPWLVNLPPTPLPEDGAAWLIAAEARMASVAAALPDWPVLVAAPDPIWAPLLRGARDARPEPLQRLEAALLEPLEPEAAKDTANTVVDFFDLDTSLRSLLRGQGTQTASGADVTEPDTAASDASAIQKIATDLNDEVDAPPADVDAALDAAEKTGPREILSAIEKLGATDMDGPPAPTAGPRPSTAGGEERRGFADGLAPTEHAEKSELGGTEPSGQTADGTERAPGMAAAGHLGATEEAEKAGGLGTAEQSGEPKKLGASNEKGGRPERPGTHEKAGVNDTPEHGLLTRLEADPTTAGLFVQDARLDGGPAGRRIEVALYAAELQLAIEIDPTFAAPSLEAYRRARTKDLWLQRRGHLVIRVLADDLVNRLEDVALQVRDVVRERRIRGRRRTDRENGGRST